MEERGRHSEQLGTPCGRYMGRCTLPYIGVEKPSYPFWVHFGPIETPAAGFICFLLHIACGIAKVLRVEGSAENGGALRALYLLIPGVSHLQLS